MIRRCFERDSAGTNQAQSRRRLICLSRFPFTISVTVLLLLSGVFFSLDAATLPSGFVETQIGGLPGATAMDFAPDGRLFVCLQGGNLRVIKNGALLPTPFLTLSVDSSGERGLLGVAFDPNFATNNFVYVYYTVPGSPPHNRASRFTANGDVAVAGSETVLLNLDNLSSASNHNGGAIHFGPDGKLYIAVGENANPSNSQTLSNLLGKILRINSDGTIPSDNPFFNTAGARKEIWALGLRNPFTFAFQPGTTRLFINDVGQNTWEEINDGVAGSNYGWPTTEGPTSDPSFRAPIFAYQHGSSSTTGCAITGGAFYSPSTVQFPSSYAGKYFFSDLCTGWIRVLDPSNNTAADFASGISFPVDLKVATDGSLYYLSIGSAAVFRIQHSPAPTATNGTVGGVITDGQGAPLAGTTISLSGAQTRQTITDSSGNYSFGNLETNGFYTVTASRANYTFSPASSSFSLLGVHTDASFTATANATQVNPLDTTEYFVRQQYLDFLGREPDESGFNFWSNQVRLCGNDATCLEAGRINTSAAFFLSIEFQQTGYLVYRSYKSAYGNLPEAPAPIKLNEFLPDTKEIGQGVVVNQAGWEQVLESNKQAFMLGFVQRPRFSSAYPMTMIPAEFVDRLFANAGVTPFGSDRADAISEFGSATTTSDMAARARALRRVGENRTLAQQEFNRAFVLMQYFGYLRRNPIDPPESTLDYRGYNFWLRKLNSFNGNFVSAEMVKAFLDSTEYRQRFGP